MDKIIKIKKFIRKEIEIIDLIHRYINTNYFNYETALIFSFLSNYELYDYEKILITRKKNVDFFSKYLQTSCNHYFVEDYIDIDLDRSQQIIYCQYCEYTKKLY